MPNSRLLSLLVFGVAFALGVVSCSQGTQEGETGSLSLQLTIAGDVEIDEVAWVITGGDMPSMNGTIDTSAPGSTASIEVFGLPPSIGKDYTITMEAIATDEETTCKGSEDFGIDIGEVTQDSSVMLNCKRPQRFGSVRVNGEFNICAELTKVVVSPLQTGRWVTTSTSFPTPKTSMTMTSTTSGSAPAARSTRQLRPRRSTPVQTSATIL